MNISIELIVFIILLIDSLGAMLFSWLGGDKWWKKHLRVFSRYFPLSKGWSTAYFIITLYIGYLTHQLGLLSF